MEHIEKIMQKDLNEIAQWKTNRIMLNVKKTAFVFIRSLQKRVQDRSLLLSINSIQIAGVDCTKYFGQSSSDLKGSYISPSACDID